jgi:predicted RNA-binding protein
MVTTTDRKLRILESRKKICAPAMLDDDLCFYSPQENVEAMKHPRVREWLQFVSKEYVPKIEKKYHAILLLLPCTMTQPYLQSSDRGTRC